jgi:hypothetical protein
MKKLFLFIIFLFTFFPPLTGDEVVHIMHTDYSTITIEGISIILYENINVKISSPVEDFYLLNFYLENENIFLKAYIGNHPQEIFSNNQKYIETNLVFTHFDGKKWVYTDPSSNKESGEVILNLQNNRWPQFIQFWYNLVDESIIKLITDIISSVKYKSN